jgi:hypothetical protein
VSDTTTPEGADPGATGHPLVDEVLQSLQTLDDRPAAEHVVVFEAAHDRLRAALTGSGDEPAAVPDPRLGS